MPKMEKYRISTILRKLGTHYSDWRLDDTVRILIPYKIFKKIMMLDEACEPVITYERTAKEKYQLLKDMDFLNDTGTVNVPLVKSYLGVEE